MADLPTDLEALLDLIDEHASQALDASSVDATAAHDQHVAHARNVAADYGLDLSDPFVAAAAVRALAVASQLGATRMSGDVVERLKVTASATAQPGEALVHAWSVTISAGHLMMAGVAALRRQGVDGD